MLYPAFLRGQQNRTKSPVNAKDHAIVQYANQLCSLTLPRICSSLRELQATQQQVVDLQQRLEGVDAVVRQFSLGRFKDNPEKMAFYTGLPDGRAFDVLWEYLDASEDTLVTVRQLPDDQRKRSRGGGRKFFFHPIEGPAVHYLSSFKAWHG